MKGVISPSKHCSIAQLERIKADNYLGADCKTNYSQEEVDRLLAIKYQRKADEDPLDFTGPEKVERLRVIVMPPYPKLGTFWDKFKLLSPSLTHNEN